MPTHLRKSSAPEEMPRLNRPPDSSSNVPAAMAISDTCMVYGVTMHVPKPMRRVAWAAAARMTHTLRRKRSLLTQNWSKPASSAARARRG